MPSLVKGNFMSRVGIKPIDIPQEAKVSLSGSRVVVKGPLALYSCTIAMMAAGAVATDTAARINANGR